MSRWLRVMRGAVFVLVLVGLGVLAGIGHAQRYAGKEPIPGSKRGEISADLNVWEYLDKEEGTRFDAIWRARIKEELIQAKPTPQAIALEMRDAARKSLYSRLAEYMVGKRTDADDVVTAAGLCLEAELAVSATKAERLRIREAHWQLMKRLESSSKKSIDGSNPIANSHYTIVHARVKAETDLLKAMAE
jgi:hypothetical protein